MGRIVSMPMPSKAHVDFAARKDRSERLDWDYALRKLFEVEKLMTGKLKVRDDSELIYRGRTFDVLGLYVRWPNMGRGHKAWNEYRVSLVGTEFDGDYDQTTVGDHDIEWIKAEEWKPPHGKPRLTVPRRASRARKPAERQLRLHGHRGRGGGAAAVGAAPVRDHDRPRRHRLAGGGDRRQPDRTMRTGTTYDARRRRPHPDNGGDRGRLHGTRAGALEEGRHMKLALPGLWRNAPAWVGKWPGWTARVAHAASNAYVERWGHEFLAHQRSRGVEATGYGRTPLGALRACARGLRSREAEASARLARDLREAAALRALVRTNPGRR